MSGATRPRGGSLDELVRRSLCKLGFHAPRYPDTALATLATPGDFVLFSVCRWCGTNLMHGLDGWSEVPPNATGSATPEDGR